MADLDVNLSALNKICDNLEKLRIALSAVYENNKAYFDKQKRAEMYRRRYARAGKKQKK